KILFIGRNNAGKTALIHRAKGRLSRYHHPDHEPQLHEVIFGKQSCLAFEQDFNNPTRTKFAETDAEGLVFVVDASGDERFDEARDRFYEVLLLELLGHAINVPVLILANKSEHIQAAPEIELYFHLKVSQLVEMGNAKGAWNVKMFMCSAEWGTGYQEVFAWLGDRL
ncbi:P-loop containing nucleoside triphosphate hydrolase protein, partial [Podospora australis]